MSGATSTTSTPSRSERSSLAGVIIFMYLHAAGLTGSKGTSGLAFESWCSMPVSVATSTLSAVVRSAGGRPCRSSRGSSSAPRARRRHRPATGRWCAPALGVDEQLGVRVLGARARRSAPLMPACTWHSPSQMCMLSRPVHCAARGAEELVRAEQDLGVLGDRGDDLDGVRRRAADVGLGLHRGGRVDVAHDHRAGVLGLPRAQLVGGDRLGQRAPGPFGRGSAPSCRGVRILAVSAMKWTPQKTIVPASLGGDPRGRASRRRGGRPPGSRAAGSCGPGSRRRAGTRGGGPRPASYPGVAPTSMRWTGSRW